MSWTPERENKLKELWKKGHTASQIASMLGETTRNAVIGKAHRLNLEARAVAKKTASKTKAENIIPNNKGEKLSRKARFKSLLLDKNFAPAIVKIEDRSRYYEVLDYANRKEGTYLVKFILESVLSGFRLLKLRQP